MARETIGVSKLDQLFRGMADLRRGGGLVSFFVLSRQALRTSPLFGSRSCPHDLSADLPATSFMSADGLSRASSCGFAVIPGSGIAAHFVEISGDFFG